MSRLYLTVIFFFVVLSSSFGQDNLKNYLDFAQKQYEKGDYHYALEYYEKALTLDSHTIDILWKYAETLRAYKDYRKAEFYYSKVYDQEEAKIYPYSLLYKGMMQKHNGKYDEAQVTFKKAMKKYYKDKKSYRYKKAKKEFQSVVWAKSAIIDTLDLSFEQLPETVNTKDAEFGHGIYNNQLVFSSLRADSISAIEEVYSPDYKTNLYQSEIENYDFNESEKIEALFKEKLNTGNGSFSLDGRRFYYSQCTEEDFNYICKIMVAQFSNGSWTYIDSLGDIINEPGTNTTMPCIANIDGQETLIFSSNREDSKGGMDLYYSKIKNGNQYGKVRSIKSLNSLDNEITPWWDDSLQRLYFSSSWHNGFGGYDIFYSDYSNKFGEPVNAGIPINSSANDIYYFKYADTSFITSNRIGVMYSKNPTCCSDIFMLKPPVIYIPPTPEETLEDLNKRLPVTLYFHNDVPDPRSRKPTTNVNYINAYDEYTAMIDTYKKEYSKGLPPIKAVESKGIIESFFIEYVDQGVADLYLFRDLLLKELDKGAKINITVQGFASPLAKTNYNVNLTKRRINSLINYLYAYNNGVFAKYLDDNAENGGKVMFSQIPFGEYTANQLTSDNPNDVQNSVYSQAAAIERKIEIQSVTYIEDKREFALITDSPVIDKGASKKGDILKGEFTIRNKSNETIKIEEVRIPCDCTSAKVSKKELAPGEEAIVTMEVDTEDLIGFTVKSIFIKLDNSEEELKLYISTEISE